MHGLLLVLVCCAISGGELKFEREPTIRKKDGGWEISFELSIPADVEVAILDKNDRVLRHLAGGVLGGKYPPPHPLKPGLSQKLVWHGEDDYGGKAEGAPFKVRIRAGMGVRFGRIIGASPYIGSMTQNRYGAPLNGLAVDEKGTPYVKMMSAVGSHGNTGLWPWHLRKFSPEGKYIRTLLPYPPSTPPEKATGFKLLDTGNGYLTPATITSLYPVFYLFGEELYNRVVDGCVVFIHSRGRRLNFFKVDGSNEVRTLEMFPKGVRVNCPSWLSIQVALSPDGKTAYYSNLAGTPYDGKTPNDIDPNWPQGRIYRQDISRTGSYAERFYDLELPDWEKAKYWIPSAWDHKTASAGIAVDAKGNVLVGDLVNQVVVEISPDGKKLSETKVPWPDKVMVSMKTGDLYIVSRKVTRGIKPPATLYNIVGRGEKAKIVASLQLKGDVGGSFALDESGDAAVIWLGGDLDRETSVLMRVEDRRHRFIVTHDNILDRRLTAITFIGYLGVDPEMEYLYVMNNQGRVWRFNGETGEGGPLKIRAVDLAVGPGGMVYTWGTGHYYGPIARYTRDLKPAPIGSTGKYTYGYLYGRWGRGASVWGLDVDIEGQVFAVWGVNDCHIRVYGKDGQLVTSYEHKAKLRTRKGEEEIPTPLDKISGEGGV